MKSPVVLPGVSLFHLSLVAAFWWGPAKPALAVAPSLTLYDNRVNWQNHTTGRHDITFEGLAPAWDTLYVPTPPGITLDHVNFNIDHTANDGRMFVIGPYFFYANNSALSSQQSSTQNIVATLPVGTTSVGLDFGSLGGAPGNRVDFLTSDGQSFSRLTAAYDGRNGPSWFAFVGLTSPTPIDSLTISFSQGTTLNIDNFSYGAVVPEPSTLVLLGLAAFTAMFFRPKRKV